jgi:hypothetical protein
VTRRLRAVWLFVVGDSRIAPLAVTLAVIAALALRGTSGYTAADAFLGVIAAGLFLSAFER